jgi:hypothetical protein
MLGANTKLVELPNETIKVNVVWPNAWNNIDIDAIGVDVVSTLFMDLKPYLELY